MCIRLKSYKIIPLLYQPDFGSVPGTPILLYCQKLNLPFFTSTFLFVKWEQITCKTGLEAIYRLFTTKKGQLILHVIYR